MSETGNGGERKRYLCFSLGSEEYALPLLRVREVIGFPEVTPIPRAPAHFLGLMDLRDQVIAVVDLRLKLKISKVAPVGETTVVICDLGAIAVGLVVDSVICVLALADAEIKERPDVGGRLKSSSEIAGVTKREGKLVVLLDIGLLLDAEEKDGLRRVAVDAA